MNTKINEKVTCPYCGDKEYHTFYYGEERLYCHKCNKEFAIKLQTTIIVKSAKIYAKQCAICGIYLHEEDVKEGKCPKCGCDYLLDNNYKDSEFTFK